MTLLDMETVKSLYYAGVIYEIHTVQDRINYYTSKYKTDFESFERAMKTQSKENFEEWDDYVEWKGFHSTLQNLQSKRRDIESGDIKVA